MLCQLFGVLQHAITSIRRDDGQPGAQCRRDLVQVRLIHGAGMKGGDLVVIQVGGDEGLRGHGVIHLPHRIAR